MKHFFRNVFRYKLTAVFFVAGQFLVLYTIFVALGIYNRAYQKEQDRLSSLYPHTLVLNVITTQPVDIFSYLNTGISTGNIVLKGATAFGVAQMGSSMKSQVLLDMKEPDTYCLCAGRLPRVEEKSPDVHEVAIGRGKESYVIKRDGKEYLTVEGEDYEVVGILGSEQSAYWDELLIFSYATLGNNAKTALKKQQEYHVEIGSRYDTQQTYTTVYGNIKSMDASSVIQAKKVDYQADSTMQTSMAKENMKVNGIVFLFCLLNCMVISEFFILQRKKEFAIKKMIGLSDMRLIAQIAGNILTLSVVALLLFVIVGLAAQQLGYLQFLQTGFRMKTVFAVVIGMGLTIVVTLCYPVMQIMRGKAYDKT